jgi:hypothetical protein
MTAAAAGMTFLLVPVDDDRWVAHLLEYDLMGSGRTRTAALVSALTAYQWCKEQNELAARGRARSELWAMLSESESMTLEELYEADRAPASAFPREISANPAIHEFHAPAHA